jgi:hypothetical protein
LIAGTSHQIAKALLKQNPAVGVGAIHESPLPNAPLPDAPLQEALSLSRRAVEIYTRLRHPNLQEAQETLAEIEKAMK